MESSLYDLVEGAGVEIHESDPSFREHQNDALWNRRAFANKISELDLPDELNRHTDKTDRWTNNWKTVRFGRWISEITFLASRTFFGEISSHSPIFGFSEKALKARL